jgi:hypothetical protein
MNTYIFTIYVYLSVISYYEELNGAAVGALRRAIAEVKERWSVIGCVAKNLLSRVPPCFGRHVKPLVPAVFVVVSTHQSTLGPRSGLCMARSPYV